MKRSPRSVSGILAGLLCYALLFNQLAYALPLLHGKQGKQRATAAQAASAAIQASAAPVPPQIASAHTVFLTNSAADANFPIDNTQAYNDVYAALRAWGHYELVSSPNQADLVFQLRGAAPVTSVSGSDNDVYSVTSPAFQLTIIDTKTNIAIWTITSPVEIAGRKKARAHWVAIAETNLVSRIKVLAGVPLSAEETADLTTAPKTHGLAIALIATGAVVGLGIAGGIILHDKFENSLANQKKSQDDFCNAHGIPLSQCAGG